MSEFSQAIEATKKQCGPEVRNGDFSYNINTLWDSAEKTLINATSWKDKALFNDRVKSGADVINARLKQWGQNTCSQIVDALQMTYARGKIEFPQAEKTVKYTKTAEAPKWGLSNISRYAQWPNLGDL